MPKKTLLQVVAEKQQIPHLNDFFVAERELKEAAFNAVVAAPVGTSLAQTALNLNAAEPELIATLTPHWQAQAILRIVRAARRKLSAEERAKQYDFPWFEKQFIHIPERVPVAKKRIAKDDLAYETMRLYVRAMQQERNKETPKIAEAKVMLTLLYRYSREEHGITWGEVKQREAKKYPQGF